VPPFVLTPRVRNRVLPAESYSNVVVPWEFVSVAKRPNKGW
jgi:hypothetical protein